MKSLILLLLVVVSMTLVWWGMNQLKRFIQPRQSFKRFWGFFFGSVLLILVVVVGMSWLILRYRAFFFTP